MCCDDAVDEDKLIVVNGCGCCNQSCYNSIGCFGISGKFGICCMNCEACCKPGAPPLWPCCCLGIKCECDGCSICNGQCHVLCCVESCAFPCGNDEVPMICALLCYTCYPSKAAGCACTSADSALCGLLRLAPADSPEAACTHIYECKHAHKCTHAYACMPRAHRQVLRKVS